MQHIHSHLRNASDHKDEIEPPIGKYLVPGELLSPESLAGYYNSNALEAKTNYDANDWADPAQMYTQFSFVLEHVNLNGKHLLDVGSGNGLFFGYLDEKHVQPESRTAIDLAEEQIRLVQEHYPGVNAIAGDFFNYEFEQTFDVVTLFGVAPCLKFMFPNKSRLAALLRLLDRAMHYAREAVAFSFLNQNCYENAESEGYEYLYFYPEEVCTLLSGAKYTLSTSHNDLVTNVLFYTHDHAGDPFRFNLNRIDDQLGLLR